MESSLNACMCNDMGEKDYSAMYAMYNYVVVMLVLPFVAAFGVFSNTINCFVFSRPTLHSSVNVYLLALSGSDFLVVSTGVFVFYSDSVRVYAPSFTDVATQGIIWVLPMGFIAQTCSVYFTVAAAADCYLKVCWRRVSRLWCTPTRARLLVLSIALFSVAYNALRFWQFELNACWDQLHNSSNIELCPTQLYYRIDVVYNVYMYMVLMTLLPFMLLSVLNVLIVRTVQRTRRMNKYTNGVLNQTTQHSPNKPTDADDSAVTMVMVVVLFLACNTLALIVNIVETFFDPDPLVVQYMTDTSNLLVVTNSSVNFIIYVLFDRVYWAELKRCICCVCGRLSSAPPGEYVAVPTSSAAPSPVKAKSYQPKLDEDQCCSHSVITHNQTTLAPPSLPF